MKHKVWMGALALWMLAACSPEISPMANDCGFCPNNTECLGDVCGCGPEFHDMGSWCLRRSPRLYVAEVLGCPCFEPFGLIVLGLDTAAANQGQVVLTNENFSLDSRENPYTGFLSNGLFHSPGPNGGSLYLPAMPLPLNNYPTFCQFTSGVECWANLRAVFQGPDTLYAQVTWGNCSDVTVQADTCRFLMTRWK